MASTIRTAWTRNVALIAFRRSHASDPMKFKHISSSPWIKCCRQMSTRGPSPTVSANTITHYIPRFQKKIEQYERAVQGIKFSTEEEERSHEERKKFDEFIQKQMRSLLGNHQPEEIRTQFLAPLYAQQNQKYLSLALELSDVTPGFLANLLRTLPDQLPRLTEDELRTFYQGGSANYNDKEFSELMKCWYEHAAKGDAAADSWEFALLFGARFGAVVPIVNAKFLQLALRPLLQGAWNREISWEELYTKQCDRMANWYEDIHLDVPMGHEKSLRVPDVEWTLALVHGICSTWKWSYHVDQRNELFKILYFTLSGLYEQRYPHWFSRESVQIHFAADLICSIVLGSDVGIKQCDAIIRYGQTLLRWDHDALTQIIRRVAARTRDANVFKRLLMAWRYEPPPY